jgi:hypothetical protein
MTATATDTAANGPTPRPIPECVLTHTVRQGEGLFAIGVLYGVRWQDIAALNGLDNPGLIFAGQVLCLPQGARPPSTASPTATASASPTATSTASTTPSATPDLCGVNPPAWYFTPNPPLCPAAPVLTSQGAAQRFENGLMVWVAAIDEYFVLYDGASQTSPAVMLHLPAPLNLKAGASVDNRVPETPPPGLQQPVSGFGLIWRAEVFGGEGVRSALGWATESEFAFSPLYQCQASNTVEWNCFLRAPNGQVLHLQYTPNIGYHWKPW